MSARLVLVAVLLAAAPAAGRGSYHAPVTPAVVAGANELVGGKVQPGWPLVVSALLVPGSDTTGAPVAAQWPSPGVHLVDARGVVVTIPLTPLGASFAIGESTQWFWLADEAVIRALTPGRYEVAPDTSGFHARGLHAAAGTLTVEAAGSPNDPRALQLRTEAALLAGHVDEALAEAGRWADADTADADAWSAKGDVLMELDRASEALVAYERAEAIAGRTKSTEEPLDLARRTRAARRRMLEQRGVLEPPTTGP